MKNAVSVKDRLKKLAIEDGKTMQDKLVTYGLERTIYRLSVSNYVERFTLKGGIFCMHYLMESMLVQQWILIFWHNAFQMMLEKLRKYLMTSFL